MFEVLGQRQLPHAPAVELHGGEYAEKASRAEFIAAKPG